MIGIIFQYLFGKRFPLSVFIEAIDRSSMSFFLNNFIKIEKYNKLILILGAFYLFQKYL